MPVDDDNFFRTTMAFPLQLLEKIDDLLHDGKKRGDLPRNMHRNPFILQLLEERVAQLSKGRSRKGSTD